MNEMTFDEWTRAWAMAPRELYAEDRTLVGPDGLLQNQALVDGYVMPIPSQYRNICSPSGLASLFVGLGGGRKR